MTSTIETPPVLARAHLVGVGGAGMSGIARILLARGLRVSGSDAKESRAFLSLRAQGAKIAVGQDAANLDLLADGPSAVVVSTAIKESNPELVEARKRGITVLHRSEALAALMVGHRVACIAGTHGKTSTTSMLTVALQHCRLDPSFAIGGDLNESGANAHQGSGGIFVAEADESDGSFLVFSPSVAVVTNVEADHLDHHGTPEAYAAVFKSFVDRIGPGGVLIACADDPGAVELAEYAEARGVRVRRYGREATGDDAAKLLSYDPVDGAGRAVISLGGKEIEVGVAVPGEHMAANGLAALLAGLELGAPLEGLLEGIAAFGACAGGSSSRAAPGASASTTTTPTTPPRSPRSCARSGRRPRAAGWSWCSSRTCTRGPGPSPRSSARRWRSPTRSWCSTCSARGRHPSPG
ncbi:hypothetical protein GCM10029964_102120 [Kibdelosporangium lantanae]